MADTPYQLRVENVSGYGQDCFFCDESSCKPNCPLPYHSTMTVFDLLKKLGVDDNVSFYNEGRGRKDVTLALIWSGDMLNDF